MQSWLGNQCYLSGYMRMKLKAFSFCICLQEQLLFFNKIECFLLLSCTDTETQQFSKTVLRKVRLLNFIVACYIVFCLWGHWVWCIKLGSLRTSGTVSSILMPHLYNGGFSSFAKALVIQLNSLKSSDFPRRIFIFSDAENPAYLVSLSISTFRQSRMMVPLVWTKHGSDIQIFSKNSRS